MSAPTDIQKAPSLIPRRYQEEIFRKAQARNVIAALDTGSGKTFISVMLIKWIALQESSTGKVIIFLVPKVNLVEQQGDVVEAQTSLRVKKLRGIVADVADRTKWKEYFADVDVLVMTAQIFLNALTHAHWNIRKVSLLIFDECHHTRGHHPYNAIMREYWQVATTERPKVFCMTASPIWNPKNPVESLKTLENNLDSEVVAVYENSVELANQTPRPVEILHEYETPPTVYSYPSQSLFNTISTLYAHRLNELGFPWDKVTARYQVAFDNLGPYCADLYIYTDMKHHVKQMHGLTIPVTNSGKSSVEILHGDNMFVDRDIPQEALEIDNILDGYRPFFESETDTSLLPIVNPLWCTPKLQQLINLLIEHGPGIQGIVFVEQRHIASCLAKVLPRFLELQDIIHTAELIGQTSTDDSTSMSLANQKDKLKMFGNGDLNLLIATSVAEEGLNFPTCDVIIRFDPLQNMVGYVQSRGRARTTASKFIMMYEKGDISHLERYRAFVDIEPKLRKAYESRDGSIIAEKISDDEDDEQDLRTRERYVVPVTGAPLTYDNAIGLLNYLCSLIPCDAFTSIHKPIYSGDFTATVQLPSILPLPAHHLTYVGPSKHSKKEAKRAVAFIAARQLHALDVFDDFLLPVGLAKAHTKEDGDGRPLSDITSIPDIMEVLVSDPWVNSTTLWLHQVFIDGSCNFGLVTGTFLPSVNLVHDGSIIETREGQKVLFEKENEHNERKLLQEYMKLGVRHCISGSPLDDPFTCFFVPIISANQPDFIKMERLVNHPFGHNDWNEIGEDLYDQVVFVNVNEFGRLFFLHRMRHDLTTASQPLDGSVEAGFPTYEAFYLDLWGRKKRQARVPSTHLLEAQRLYRKVSADYSIDPLNPVVIQSATLPAIETRLFPQGCCQWLDISRHTFQAFQLLPALLQIITDVSCARQARVELALPAITDCLMVQALKIPSAAASFNNQRLETLGDSVLKLCTTVHLINKYPHRHEGQLTALRKLSIANATLLARAKDIELERFISSENHKQNIWTYNAPCRDLDSGTSYPVRKVKRSFPRRSLQDCMEALLGAGFSTGGIDMALRTGDALGLAFGGFRPWSMRYSRSLYSFPIPSMFRNLQEHIGYTFHQSALLIEAVTHPSFTSSYPSYQRLEFLGDGESIPFYDLSAPPKNIEALLDLVVMRHLYDRFPNADSEQLSKLRARVVCSPTLASVAIRKLNVHKLILMNSAQLGVAISEHAPLLDKTSSEDIIQRGWLIDPPKALGDIVESILGAVLVDSAYDFEKAASVAELVLADILPVLSLPLCLDPVSELVQWMARLGCNKVKYQKVKSRPKIPQDDSIVVLVHGTPITGPVLASTFQVAKCLAAEKALAMLGNPESPESLSLLCDCKSTIDVEMSG